jgi:hypothetical protein
MRELWWLSSSGAFRRRTRYSRYGVAPQDPLARTDAYWRRGILVTAPAATPVVVAATAERLYALAEEPGSCASAHNALHSGWCSSSVRSCTGFKVWGAPLYDI